MSTPVTEHELDTPGPVGLYVENGSGTVTVTAEETGRTTVRVSGRHAEETIVRRDGDQVSVLAPRIRTGFLGGDSKLDMEITVPTASMLVVRVGSADVTARGSFGGGQVKSGSGDVVVETLAGPASIETGSGEVQVARADRLRVKSGSGDVRLDAARGAVTVSTGSGDVEIGTSDAPAVVKTGSGDLSVTEAHDDVAMSTGSGDFLVRTATRGRLSAKGASGDVHVGIPAGVPVWTDISTVSGEIRSGLRSVGEPEPGADHVEVRARSVSGDIVLTETEA